jgi:hypothetical protein
MERPKTPPRDINDEQRLINGLMERPKTPPRDVKRRKCSHGGVGAEMEDLRASTHGTPNVEVELPANM